MFQPCACVWCCNTKTSASSVLLTASFVLCPVFSFLSQSCIHLIMLSLHLDTCALRLAQVRSEKISHFHGSGAFALTHKILALPCLWSKHQRLGIAEGVIHELQEQLQRVSAGHQAMHQELSTLRSQVDTRSRVRLVEPKTLMPDRFGKKNRSSWRTRSYLARDLVHAVLKQAMKTAKNQKQPISATHLQHQFGVTNEKGQELHHFLISRTEGEAPEVVRGAEREPVLEQWRRLAALCDPLAAGRSLDDSRQNLVSTESCQNR